MDPKRSFNTKFHPMKGPMVTQTLQDIIGHEPFHWRGDRDGIESFNPAFGSVNGDDEFLTEIEMAEFKSFLATISLPPNPFRNLDNSLPESLPLDGHFETGRFGAAGSQLPPGNAVRGLELYRGGDDGFVGAAGLFTCVQCHSLPTGMGSASFFNGSQFLPIEPGPMGNAHAGLTVDGFTQKNFKVPQLRNLFDRVGFNLGQPRSLAGFGFTNDGAIDSIARFLSLVPFDARDSQDVADLVALMLAFSGSDFGPAPAGAARLEPPGLPSNDVHAAVGYQINVSGSERDHDRAEEMMALADNSPRIELIAHRRVEGRTRGWWYRGDGEFVTDAVASPAVDFDDVVDGATTEDPVRFMIVPAGTGGRLALDRDGDGALDGDEFRAGSPTAQGVSEGAG